MLGNGIKQTTATTGTGLNLTLALVAGHPTFANVLPISVPFEYTALDSNGLFIESGFGYLSDASTMVRARISATFVGGVYNSANPTPTNLTGTTTIICTPHAATVQSALLAVDGQTAGIGRFLTSASRSLSQSPQSLASLVVYYVAFLLRCSAPIVSLAYNITAAGSAGSVMRLGIYAVNEKGYIGKLLATTGDLDSSTTGLKVGTLAQPIAIPSGDYFTAIVVSGGGGGTSYSTGGGQMMGGGPLGFVGGGVNPVDLRQETVATAVLPATASPTTSGTGVGVMHPPCVFLGMQ